MKKLTMPASQHFAKPEIDFMKTKLEMFKRLDENNGLRDADPDFKKALPRIGGSIKTTAEMLLKLLIKKLKQGKLQSLQTVSFTYSYFIKHIDSRLKKSALKEHFIRLCDTYKSVLSKRYRGLLTLPTKTINCITIEFAPGVLQFTEPAYNQLTNMDVKPFRLNLSSAPLNSQVTHNTPAISAERTGSVQKISDAFGAFFRST